MQLRQLRPGTMKMPNVAALLKNEMSRLARKEVRGEVAALRKAASSYRTEIAALKKRTHSIEAQLKRLLKQIPQASQAVDSSAEDPGRTRFSAKGLASQRRRLGLSAAECGRLLGASGQSVYNWEAGKARPRASHLAAIAALKTLGKKSAAAVLASTAAD